MSVLIFRETKCTYIAIPMACSLLGVTLSSCLEEDGDIAFDDGMTERSVIETHEDHLLGDDSVLDKDGYPARADGRPYADTDLYMKTYGVSEEEAIRQEDQIELAGLVQPALERELADIYGGMWVTHDPEFRIVVALTEPDRPAVEQILNASADDLPLPASLLSEALEIRIVDNTLETLLAAQEAFRAAADQRRVALNWSNVDVRRNRVEVHTLGVGSAEDLLHSAGAMSFVTVVEDEKEVGDDTGSPPTEADSNHGLDTPGSSPGFDCTSGFTLYNLSTGTKYMSTAGHCGNTKNYGSAVLTFVGEQNSGNLDVQWHTTSVTTYRRRYTGVSHISINAVKHRDNMVIGQQLCRRGSQPDTQTISCDFEIDSKTFAPDGSHNATFIRVVPTDGDDPADEGDSGMGWAYSTTAYGIHKKSDPGDAWAAFGAASYLPADANLAVWITG